MTLNDLLGCPVLSDDNQRLGHVIDVRLKTAGADRPVQILPFDALIVSRRRVGSFFGYERRREQGPAVLARLFRWLHRDAQLVPWSQVARWEAGEAVVLVPGASSRRVLGG